MVLGMVVATFIISSRVTKRGASIDEEIAPDAGWHPVAGRQVRLQPGCNQSDGRTAARCWCVSGGVWPLRTRRSVRLVAEVLDPLGVSEVAAGSPARLALPCLGVEVPSRRAERAFRHQAPIGSKG